MLSREEIKEVLISDLKKVHMIGILSPFSSFCARQLLNHGVDVTASEYVQGDPGRKPWEDEGVLYAGGHNEDFITEDLDLVVCPNGPIPNNPECEKTEKLGIPMMTMSQMAGVLSRGLKTIAVAGTHGKTTTTALIIWMLSQLEREPNFLIGDMNDRIFGLNKNWNSTKDSEYFVVECCEYKRQFLDRAPTPFISVITNIALDHTDYFKNIDDYNDAFGEFVSNTVGTVVMDCSKDNEKKIMKNSLNRNSELQFEDVAEVLKKEKFKVKSLPGIHNQENLVRAFVTGILLGFKADKVRSALESFPGVTLRFEFAGKTANGNPVHKDFAHNPDKIAACIGSAKEAYPERKVLLVFQPHSHERSYTSRKEFADAIAEADVVLVPNIFSPKRESDEERAMITAEEFVSELQKKHNRVEYTQDFESTILRIKEVEYQGDWVVVLASAGDLHKISNELIKN